MPLMSSELGNFVLLIISALYYTHLLTVLSLPSTPATVMMVKV